MYIFIKQSQNQNTVQIQIQLKVCQPFWLENP